MDLNHENSEILESEENEQKYDFEKFDSENLQENIRNFSDFERIILVNLPESREYKDLLDNYEIIKNSEKEIKLFFTDWVRNLMIQYNLTSKNYSTTYKNFDKWLQNIKVNFLYLK